LKSRRKGVTFGMQGGELGSMMVLVLGALFLIAAFGLLSPRTAEALVPVKVVRRQRR